jgi:hypothetical protein
MHKLTFAFILILSISCSRKEFKKPIPIAEKKTIHINYEGTEVALVIDKPALDSAILMIVYHGTVMFDDKIIEAAENSLEGFKKITLRDDILWISVAYPEENLLFGDNIKHAEAGLLWSVQNASKEFNIKIKKTFLVGHSQGGYLATRLNTMHQTHGVIANAPGPLNLVYRCEKEENGDIPKGLVCNLLRTTYGTTSSNPSAYFNRSLLSFTNNHKSDILFVQGLQDSPIQMYSWSIFKQNMEACSDCKERIFVEVPNMGHTSLFNSNLAQNAYNQFIEER